MKWLDVMFEEHAVVLKAVAALKLYAQKVKNGKQVPQELFGELIDVIRDFADKCHHGKEEDVLFPLIKKRQPKEKKVIDEFLNEHVEGREFVAAMLSGLTDEMVAGAEGYAALLVKHIQKENKAFTDWNRLLSADDKQRLADEFEQVEKKVMGDGAHEKYVAQVERITKQLQR